MARYFIKTIGIKNNPIDLTTRWEKMMKRKMCFGTLTSLVESVSKGDIFVVYCVIGGTKQFPQGGFIGILEVIGESVEKDPSFFSRDWPYIVDVKCKLSLATDGSCLPLKLTEVRNFEKKSALFESALSRNLQGWGGLFEIDKSDFEYLAHDLRRRGAEENIASCKKWGYLQEVWDMAKEKIREILIEQAKVGNTIYYSDLTPRVKVIRFKPNSPSFFEMLGEISDQENANGRGMLSVVVVNKDTELPGKGFF